ncbi:MAG: outer membrane beta-barrel protein [Bacteroidetes bacterium]|nr:outer membrane beta-barrel protein [Bacteroidota bacterium]
MHIGLHSGLQTGILRYNVFPYTGEFQSTMERSIVAGFTLGFPVSEVLRLQVDIAWGEQSWSAQHDGDPKIEILRTKRSSIEFPFMLQYHVPSLPIPLYIAGGPRVSLLVGGEDAFVVSYTGYSEREGKQTTRWNYRENTMGMAISGEIGLEPSFTSRLSMQVALRYTQPLGRAVDEDRFSLQELSIWRARVGVLLLL